jgi:glycolate oxidase FAD binding subunit
MAAGHCAWLLSSVSDRAVHDQLDRIQSLAAEHGLAKAEADALPLAVGSWRWPCHKPVQVTAPSASRSKHASTDHQQRPWPPSRVGLGSWQPEPAAAMAGAATPAPTFQIEALRRQVESLGGQLMVLVQTRDQPLVAWRDTPARPVIEAVKRQFDPLQQLSRGRLPGVDQHQTRA